MSAITNGRHRLTSSREVQLPPKIKALCDEIGFNYPQQLAGTGMFISQQEIDPDMALSILADHHIPNNRSPKKTKIPSYSDDMRRGKWHPTHQGIAFNEDCLLFDGQNRLYACIEADTAFDTLITFNVRNAAMGHTDGVSTRTIMDVVRIEGREFKKRYAAIARVLVFGSAFGRQMSHSRVFEIVSRTSPVFQFINEQFPVHINGKTTAPVLGAIARAWYHVDHKRLAEFCRCIRESTVKDENDYAARKLNEWLGRNAGGRTGHLIHSEVYLKTQAAIVHFVSMTTPDRLRVATHDQFPLPGDVRDVILG